jgi:tetratricopeptide (TPR) repeat protein
MTHSRRLFFIAALICATAGFSIKINQTFPFPFPPFNQLIFDISDEFSDQVSYKRPLGSEGGFRDFAGLLFGSRRLTADIGWISLLQYYGMHERGEESYSALGKGKYPSLKKMVFRVTRLDPTFHYAYLYGAGSLAFNLNRPEEALDILKEGIENSPTYWRFRLYVGAIVYKQKGRFDDMIALLEDATRYPDCPTLVKSVLANIYKERKNYKRALEIWIGVLEGNERDSWYREQAGKQIAELRPKLGI